MLPVAGDLGRPAGNAQPRRDPTWPPNRHLTGATTDLDRDHTDGTRERNDDLTGASADVQHVQANVGQVGGALRKTAVALDLPGHLSSQLKHGRRLVFVD